MNRTHQNEMVLQAGLPLAEARAAMVLVHGRGATAESILMSLAAQLPHPAFTYLAPQAAGNTWYPYSFLAPLQSNEPYLSSALQAVDEVLKRINAAGIPFEKVIVLGFSQGACLSLEYCARHARRYGGVVGLSGGLIGPDGTPRDYAGSLAGTPVFLGCSDVDPHIPKDRVHHTTEVLTGLGAVVTERIYPGMGHLVNDDEMGFVRGMMRQVAASNA